MAAEIVTNEIRSTMNTAQIQDMIAQLEQTENGQSLKSAMDKLQVALLENPDACALMSPEDIGEMVKHLRRLTGQLIAAEASKKKSNGAKSKELVAEGMKALDEDDLFDS